MEAREARRRAWGRRVGGLEAREARRQEEIEGEGGQCVEEIEQAGGVRKKNRILRGFSERRFK